MPDTDPRARVRRADRRLRRPRSTICAARSTSRSSSGGRSKRRCTEREEGRRTRRSGADARGGRRGLGRGRARANRLPPTVGSRSDVRPARAAARRARRAAEPAVRRAARRRQDRARAPDRARPARARAAASAGARRRLWATSADRIVAGMVYLGMWQQRCLQIVKELEGGDDVLYVDRLADVAGADVRRRVDRRSARARGDRAASSRCSPSATRPSSCARASGIPALVDALRVVRVPEAAPAQTSRCSSRTASASIRRSRSSHDAARRLVELLAAFRRDTAFPGKALAFVDYLAHASRRRPALSLAELTAAFARVVGLAGRAARARARARHRGDRDAAAARA